MKKEGRGRVVGLVGYAQDFGILLLRVCHNVCAKPLQGVKQRDLDQMRLFKNKQLNTFSIRVAPLLAQVREGVGLGQVVARRGVRWRASRPALEMGFIGLGGRLRWE